MCRRLIKLGTGLGASLLLACNESSAPTASESDVASGDADATAKAFVERIGEQNVRALTWNWKNGRPPDLCYAIWAGEAADPSRDKSRMCELWAEDLSGLFASYGVEADPAVFKSPWFKAFRDDSSYYGSQYLGWEEGADRHPDCSDYQSTFEWKPKVIAVRMGQVGCPESPG